MTEHTMTTTVPFSGFYESIHSSEMDRELEQMTSDSSGCHPISDRIAEDLWMHCHYPFTQYAKEYCEDFAIYFKGETKLELTGWEFDTLVSPREYNFTTDRIFAKLPFATVKKLFEECDKTILDEIIRQRFTSRSGFSSFYTPRRDAWGELETWDHNQVACIILALVKQHFGENWEMSIIEDWSGNGIISNWMYDGLDDEGKRLVKIGDYLRARQERPYRARTR